MKTYTVEADGPNETLMDLAIKITPTPTQKALIERIRDAFSRQGCSV